MADGKTGTPVFPDLNKVGRDPARKSYGPGWTTVRAPSGGTQVVRSSTAGPAAPKEESGGGGGGGGSGGGGGPSLPPSMFPGDSGINLKSRSEIEQGYQQAIERGEKMLEALGHESFRDLAASALASKFTLPDNYEQFLSGQTSQPVTGNTAQFNAGGIQNVAQNALQTGLNQIPTGGQNSGNT